MKSADPAPHEPHRSVDLGDGARYEIAFHAEWPRLVGLRLWDVCGDDALVYLDPANLRGLIANLGSFQRALGEFGDRSVASPRAEALLGAMRRNFELLAELAKTSPGEVDHILALAVAHIRSWRPFALLVSEAP